MFLRSLGPLHLHTIFIDSFPRLVGDKKFVFPSLWFTSYVTWTGKDFPKFLYRTAVKVQSLPLTVVQFVKKRPR